MMIRRGFSKRGNPSALETYIAKTARRFSIPASERNATNPFAPTTEVLGEARANFPHTPTAELRTAEQAEPG